MPSPAFGCSTRVLWGEYFSLWTTWRKVSGEMQTTCKSTTNVSAVDELAHKALESPLHQRLASVHCEMQMRFSSPSVLDHSRRREPCSCRLRRLVVVVAKPHLCWPLAASSTQAHKAPQQARGRTDDTSLGRRAIRTLEVVSTTRWSMLAPALHQSCHSATILHR